jgi:hypothetical protein
MRIIRIVATLGATVGVGIAGLMIPLVLLRPFSVPVNGFIERATFRLCPFFIMGFSKDVTSKTSWLLITIAGNAFLYGAVFAVIALGVVLFRKYTARRIS